jgi:hypothetical protein
VCVCVCVFVCIPVKTSFFIFGELKKVLHD